MHMYLNTSTFGIRGRLQSNMPQSDRISVGHAVEDFILDCTYLDYQCNADHFSLYMHPSYWNCFTFKGISEKGNPNPNYNNIGPNNGLSLILATQKPVINVFYDAGSKSKNTHGFKVSVHEPGTDPAISETGIDILPGMSTCFALEQKEYHRLKYPYAYCQEGTVYNVSNHLFNMTPALCHKACLAEYVLEKCNCLSTQVDIFFTSPETENVKYCLHANESDPLDSVEKTLCEISVLKNISNIPAGQCDCGWTCHEVDYDVLVSQVEWPQKFTIVNFLETYIKASSSKAMKFIFEELRNYYKNPNMSSSCAAKLTSSDLVLMVTNKTINLLNSSVLEEIKKSNITSCVDKKLTERGSFEEALEYWVKTYFYRLNVYFRKGVVEKHQQVVAFGLLDLWTSVGGSGGLWFGASLLSVVETGYLLSKLILYLSDTCRYRFQNSKVKTSTTATKSPQR